MLESALCKKFTFIVVAVVTVITAFTFVEVMMKTKMIKITMDKSKRMRMWMIINTVFITILSATLIGGNFLDLIFEGKIQTYKIQKWFIIYEQILRGNG